VGEPPGWYEVIALAERFHRPIEEVEAWPTYWLERVRMYLRVKAEVEPILAEREAERRKYQ
jgi:hypothetical protein